MMRKQIAGTIFFGGLVAWLVAAGLLIAAQPEWTAWVIWGLVLPTLIVVCAFIVGRPRPVPNKSTGVTNITINEIKPRFGEMKGENE